MAEEEREPQVYVQFLDESGRVLSGTNVAGFLGSLYFPGKSAKHAVAAYKISYALRPPSPGGGATASPEGAQSSPGQGKNMSDPTAG
ncbi:hypothetical protein ACFV6E_30490 [Streptomyces sp. NPDC059785]|uniref:hypothetical protein n=1 Tax=unclassified Streptomyces TaxID=2593676 RepID=UPI003650FF9E